MTYTMGSLFAGIGGFDLGFERAGFKTSWQVEIDPYCQKVLAKNFPEAERFGDIRECGRHNLKRVDVICGGFPCQDISNAGLRVGIEGERSGLVTEAIRIIRELRPEFVLLENVAALLGRGMGAVLGYLAEIGYDAEWKCISAADLGAPHLRERIWILAHPRHSGIHERWGGINAFEEVRNLLGNVADVLSGGEEEEGQALADAQRMRELQPQGGQQDERGRASDGCSHVAYSDGNNAQGEFAGSIDAEEWCEPGERSLGPRHASFGGQWAVEPNVGRVAHGVPKRVDRLRGLGNAVVPQIPEMIARRIKQALEAA